MPSLSPWTDNIDPKTIPDPVLLSEAARRRGAKRLTPGRNGGRPPKLAPCPKCGELLGVAAMRKHRAACTS